MGMNVGYLTAGRDAMSDECLTPRYAVTPIVKYLKLKGYKNILCPFDKDDSFYVRVLKDNGFNVQNSHLENRDFFDIKYFDYFDCIVSNPPFSIKDKVLKRLYEIKKPFAILLPQNSLQSNERVDMFIKHGVEYLGFRERINFYTNGNLNQWTKGNHFASAYFCKNVLPEKLIFEVLTPVQEPYLTLEEMI
jgi:hypothetical protein